MPNAGQVATLVQAVERTIQCEDDEVEAVQVENTDSNVNRTFTAFQFSDSEEDNVERNNDNTRQRKVAADFFSNTPSINPSRESFPAPRDIQSDGEVTRGVEVESNQGNGELEVEIFLFSS